MGRQLAVPKDNQKPEATGKRETRNELLLYADDARYLVS